MPPIARQIFDYGAARRMIKNQRNLQKTVKQLKRTARDSLSHVDMSAVSQAISTTPTFYLLNGMSTGTTEGTRLGNDIGITRIKIKGAVIINGAASRSLLRIMVVYDKGADNATFLTSDLLGFTASPNNLYSFFRTDTDKRFTVIADKLLDISDNGPQIRKFSINKKYKTPKVTKYSANAGTISDIETGSLYIWTVSSEGVNTVNLNFTSRVDFET